MSTLSDTIFSLNDMVKERVVVPEWAGIEVELRSLTALERATITGDAQDMVNGGKVDYAQMYASALIAGVYDPTVGEPIFTENDRVAILSRNGSVVERLASKILGNSKITGGAVETSKSQFLATAE